MGKRVYSARVPGIGCPHCGAKTIVRDSVEVTPLVRELRLLCSDDDCGFSGVAQLSVIRQVRASTNPNPEVRLPFGTWAKRPPANDDHREPANDTSTPQEAADTIGAALAAVFVT